MSGPHQDGPERTGSEPAETAAVARPPEARRGPSGLGAPLYVGATGFVMGAAELVPGFSGGTVVLVAGLYQRLIGNVRQGARALSLLLRGRLRAGLEALGAIEWAFIAALGVGNLIALVVLARALGAAIEGSPVTMSAVFFGLIVGATVVASGELRRPSPRHLVVALAVGVVVALLLGTRGGTVVDPPLLALFLAGSVAVCAFILPGVSGSFVLLLLGVYQPVIGAVGDRDLLIVATVGAGCVAGLAAFSTFLHWLLHRHHDMVLASLLGLMAGSTRVLWPWPSADGVGDPTLGAPQGEIAAPVLAALVAVVAVVAVGVLARRLAGAPAPTT